MQAAGAGRAHHPSPRATVVAIAAGLAIVAACSGTTVVGEVSQSTPGTGGSGGGAGSSGGSAGTGNSTGSGGLGGQGGGGSACDGGATFFCLDGVTVCNLSDCPAGTGGGAAGTGGAAGVAGTGGGGPTGGAGGGALSNFPSCAGMTGTECNGGNCCDSLALPGGTVDVDGKQWTVPRFRLDKYEVTVARMRRYMNAAVAWGAAGNPKADAGAHPLVPGSGWRTDWLATVAASPLKEGISNGLLPTWMNYPISWGSSPDAVIGGGNPNYPIAGTDQLAVNRVPFHIAVAFCVWDGGRLPAKAEFLLAFQGGDGTALYPWGDTPAPAQMFATTPPPTVPTPYNDPVWNYYAIPVGSHPASVGRFGHHDLGAGLSEYLRDAAMAGGAASTGGFIELGGDERVGFESFDENINYSRTVANPSWLSPRASFRVSKVSAVGEMGVGLRCARDM
jgi:formylglycine-generating enzyme required for sulfatase activity